MTDQDPAGGQHLLDYAQTERKLEIEPHGMADHLSRKAVVGIVKGRMVSSLTYAAIRSPSG